MSQTHLLCQQVADCSFNLATRDQYQNLIAAQEGFVIMADIHHDFIKIERENFETEQIADQEHLVVESNWINTDLFNEKMYEALGSTTLGFMGTDSASDEIVDPVEAYSAHFGVDSNKAGSDPAVAETAGEHIAKGVLNAAFTGSYTVNVLADTNMEALVRDTASTTYSIAESSNDANLDKKLTDALKVAADALTRTEVEELLADVLANNGEDTSGNETLLSSYLHGQHHPFFQNTLFHMNCVLNGRFQEGDEVAASEDGNSYNGTVERIKVSEIDAGWLSKSKAILYNDAGSPTTEQNDDVARFAVNVLFRLNVQADPSVDASNQV
jgi:hypothetical protein